MLYGKLTVTELTTVIILPLLLWNIIQYLFITYWIVFQSKRSRISPQASMVEVACLLGKKKWNYKSLTRLTNYLCINCTITISLLSPDSVLHLQRLNKGLSWPCNWFSVTLSCLVYSESRSMAWSGKDLKDHLIQTSLP